MAVYSKDHRTEKLREIINNYSRNPEYINSDYTKQEAIEALNDRIRQNYFRIKQN